MEEKEKLEQRLNLCDKYMSNTLTSQDYRELMKVLGVGSIAKVTTDAVLEIKKRIQDEYDIKTVFVEKKKKVVTKVPDSINAENDTLESGKEKKETPKKTTDGGKK